MTAQQVAQRMSKAMKTSTLLLYAPRCRLVPTVPLRSESYLLKEDLPQLCEAVSFEIFWRNCCVCRSHFCGLTVCIGYSCAWLCALSLMGHFLRQRCKFRIPTSCRRLLSQDVSLSLLNRLGSVLSTQVRVAGKSGSCVR